MNSSIKIHKPLLLLKRNFGQINLEKLLTEEHKRKTIEKFKKYTKLRIGVTNPEKHAAVLIPLCIVDNEISVLYTIRSSKMRNYSGQVCFPGKWLTFTLPWPKLISSSIVGGKMDDTDYHEIECALRETEEEIGLSSEFIDVCQFLSLCFVASSLLSRRFGAPDRK